VAICVASDGEKIRDFEQERREKERKKTETMDERLKNKRK